jgi:predicted nucleotidyltransferase
MDYLCLLLAALFVLVVFDAFFVSSTITINHQKDSNTSSTFEFNNYNLFKPRQGNYFQPIDYCKIYHLIDTRTTYSIPKAWTKMNEQVSAIAQVVQTKFLDAGAKLILLCDDELYFMKCLSRYRSNKSSIISKANVPSEQDKGGMRHLYAFYAAACTELLIDSPKKTLSQYILAKQNQHDKKVAKGQNSILEYSIQNITFIEIGQVVTKLLKGDARIIEILLGDRYLYKGTNRSGDGGGALQVLFASPEWLNLRETLIAQSVLGSFKGSICFFKSLLGQAYGLLKNVRNSQFSDIPNALYSDMRNFINYLIAHIRAMVESTFMLAESTEEKNRRSWGSAETREVELTIMLKEVEFFNSLYKKTIAKSKDQKIKAIPANVSSGTKTACCKWKDELRHSTCATWLLAEQGKPSIFQSRAAEAGPYSGKGPESTASGSVSAALARLDLHGNIHSQLGEGTEITFMIRCGSFLYNLDTKGSDEDYFICFTSPTNALLRSKPPATQFERHVAKPMGADKAGEVEYAGKEVGLFLQELAKGNPRNIEFLFAAPSRAINASPLWSKLRMFRKDFLTGRCIVQYLGFISERLHRVRKMIRPFLGADGATMEKISYEAENGISKYFYHAFHKIFELKRIVHYKDPIVRFPNGSDEREFIISIRKTRPMAGEFNPSVLLAKAERMLKETKQEWNDVDKRRKENGQSLRRDEVDVAKLMKILKAVRLQYFTDYQINTAVGDGGIDEHTVELNLEPDDKHGSSKLSFSPPNADTRAVIMERLREIEKTLEIKIIYAAELSSRSLGTAHSNSDHDLYCIFVHQCNKYFSMKSFSKNFRMTYAKDVSNRTPEIDIVGQECSHCFQMMSTSNLTMFELFFSPIVYIHYAIVEFDWVECVRDTMRDRYKARSLIWCCISHAKQNYAKYISRKESGKVLGKKYLHVIRRILMALWVARKETDGAEDEAISIWPLPYSIQMQLECIGKDDTDILPQDVRETLEQILSDTDNREARLGRPTVKIPVFDSFIQRSVKILSDYMKKSSTGEKKKPVGGLPLLVRQQSDATVWDEISCDLIRKVLSAADKGKKREGQETTT